MSYTLVPSELIVDGAITSAKLDTNISISGTLGVTGELTLATHLNMGDNDKIKIGTGGDLEIYHDGSNSYIANSTGNIYIADTNGSVHIQAKLNEESIVATADGAVTLYHDNSAKLATASGGVTVTGTLTATTLAGTLSTAAQTNITSLGTLTTLTVDDITINSSTISDAGDLTIDVAGAIILDSDGADISFKDDGTEFGNITNKGGDLVIGTNTCAIRTHDSTSSVRPANANDGTAQDGVLDLGSSAARWKDLYLSGGAYLGGTGSANHLDDYEEGTWTPTFQGATLSTAVGHYTKIGNQVTVHYTVVTTGGLPSSGTQVQVGGLPFAQNSGNLSAGSVYCRYYTPNDSALTIIVQDGESVIRYININDQSFDYTLMGELEASANNSIYTIGTITYIV